MAAGSKEPREVAHPEKGLRDLSASVIEAALRNCGYEGVVVDAAIFKEENDGVFSYFVGTVEAEKGMVLALAFLSLCDDGTLLAVLLNQQVFEGMDFSDGDS